MKTTSCHHSSKPARRHLHITALATVVCLSLAQGANADRYFPNDATISETFPTGDNVIVGYANIFDLVEGTNGTSPTVTVGAGGNIDSGFAFNGSTLKVDGGRVSGNLDANDHATVSLASGGNDFGGDLRAFAHGTIIMSGGSIGGVTALEGGMLDVSGGVIQARVNLAGAATGTVSGATIGHGPGGPFIGFEGMVTTRDSSQLEMGTVVVILDVKATNTSEIRMSNSTIMGGVQGLDTTTLMISGGSVGGSVFGYDLDMTGGTVGGSVGIAGTDAVGTVSNGHVAGGLSVSGAGAILSASGGMIAGGVNASGGSTLSLSGLQLDGSVNGFNATVSASSADITGDVSIQGSVALSTATFSECPIVGNVTATGGQSAARNATISMTGGSVSGGVTANDRSSITLISTTAGADVTANSGSPVGSLIEIQDSTVTGNALSKNSGAQVRLSGGTIMGDLKASNRAAVTILDGTVNGKLMLIGRSSGIMGGGSVAGTAELDAITFTMTGGNIAGKVSVTQFSQFNLSNGILGAALEASGESTTIMTGGSIGGSLVANESSSVDMSGGTVANGASAEGRGTLTISGGQINGGILGFDNSHVSISGGQAVGGLGLVAQNASTIDMSGGSTDTQALVRDDATLNLSGTAQIDGPLVGIGKGTINFSGGRVQSPNIQEESTLNLSGSSLVLGDLSVFESGKFDMSGGRINGRVVGNGTGSRPSTVTGGTIHFLVQGFENWRLIITGGTFETSIIAGDSSVISLSGGSVSVLAQARQDGQLIIHGTAFIGEDVLAFDRSVLRISGGSVQNNVVLDNESTLVLSGGTIAGALIGTNKASGVMTGGVVGRIEAQGDNPTAGFTIGGGQVTDKIKAFNHSGILLVGGSVQGDVQASDTSLVEIEGTAAIAGSLAGFNFSTVNIRGGSVGVGPAPGNLQATDNAVINLSGGTVGGDLIGFNTATVNMSGGTVFGRGVFVHARFNFSGGRILGGISQAPGLRVPRGGEPQPLAITASDGATISIFGGNLVATLVDPNADGMSKYQLSGRLADGTVIDGGFLFVQNGTETSHVLRAGGQWKIDGGGSWGLAGNWASATVPEGSGALALFPGVLTAPNSPAGINLDGNRTLGSLRFDSANAYLIQPGSGGSLTLDNSGSLADLTVLSGHHRIAAPVIAQDDPTAYIASGASLFLEDGITLAAGKTLTKTGEGELSAAFVSGGALNIEAGVTLILPESGAGVTTSTVTVGTDGTLGGTGPFSAAINVAGRLAPGDHVGTMTSNNTVTFGPGSGYNFGIADWNGVAGTGYDTLTANSVTITATAENKLTVYVDGGALTNFSESPRTFTLASAATALTGLTAENWAVATTNFPGTGTWTVRAAGNIFSLTYSAPGYDAWIAEYPGVDPSPAADTDGDTFAQLLEYVLGGNPSIPGEPIAPVSAKTGNAFSFTFRRADRSEGDTIAIVRYTSDLSEWIEVPIGAVSGGIVSITENGTVPDTVVVTIPAPGSRMFAQLLITRL